LNTSLANFIVDLSPKEATMATLQNSYSFYCSHPSYSTCWCYDY